MANDLSTRHKDIMDLWTYFNMSMNGRLATILLMLDVRRHLSFIVIQSIDGIVVEQLLISNPGSVAFVENNPV